MGFILNHDRTAVPPANHDGETPAERSTYERFNQLLVVQGRVTKRQRQNSSVRTRRETNPARWLDFAVDVELTSGADEEGATSGWNPGSPDVAVTWPAEFSGIT
jgi:hypothetical protein